MVEVELPTAAVGCVMVFGVGTEGTITEVNWKVVDWENGHNGLT